MTTNVSDIMKIVEEIAPLRLAEKWDNSGLQVGSKDWPVKKVVLSLDPLPEVVEYACSINADLLVTHHPLIFKPLSSVDFSSPTGKIIKMSMENRLAIYSAHTNYDSVGDGLNDILASRIGLKEVAPFSNSGGQGKCKLVFYAPVEQKDKVLQALFETTAGIIGNYTCCSFLSDGTGTFKPVEGAKPYSGNIGEISTLDEVRIETVVESFDVDAVVNQIRKHHPYDTMAYDVYPLLSGDKSSGIGRTGFLPEPVTLAEFSAYVKEKLGLDYIKFAGNRELKVEKVALCTGSGSGLMKEFLRSGAQVYLSGDLHYHDARMVEEKGLGLVDAGHFASEILIVEALQQKIQQICLSKNFDIEVIACAEEKDPFVLL